MIKILHIVPTFGIGGLEHGVAKLANGLPPDPFRIDILSLYKIPGKQFHLHSPTKHIQLNLLDFNSPVSKLKKLTSLIYKGQYHIVHTHNWPTMIYGLLASKLAFVPLIIHGEHSSKSTSNKSLFLQRIITLLPNHFTAVCDPLSLWMQQYWKVPPQKISTIPNGIDTNRFYPAEDKNKSTFTIGSVGRLEEVKNFPYLIRSFKSFIDNNPKVPVQLLLVGGGPKKKDLESLAEELGLSSMITFTGESQSPEVFYRQMNIYVNPNTTREGMNNCILEAMACGLPIITASLDSNRSWLKENENALFFNPDEQGDLVNKIIYLFQNSRLRQEMSEQNLMRATNEFKIDIYIERYKNLYINLLKNENSRINPEKL